MSSLTVQGYYDSRTDYESLVVSLDGRGFRESELLKQLTKLRPIFIDSQVKAVGNFDEQDLLQHFLEKEMSYLGCIDYLRELDSESPLRICTECDCKYTGQSGHCSVCHFGFRSYERMSDHQPLCNLLSVGANRDNMFFSVALTLIRQLLSVFVTRF